MLTFTSLPSRVLMLSVGPSTASMVPRMRTGGGCCAHATVVRTDAAATAAVIQDVSFGMAHSPQVSCDQPWATPGSERYSVKSAAEFVARDPPVRNCAPEV